MGHSSGENFDVLSLWVGDGILELQFHLGVWRQGPQPDDTVCVLIEHDGVLRPAVLAARIDGSFAGRFLLRCCLSGGGRRGGLRSLEGILNVGHGREPFIRLTQSALRGLQ